MQGQGIGICVIVDIIVRRLRCTCACDSSSAVRRPVAGGRYLHTAYIKLLSARRSRQRRGGQHGQAEQQDRNQGEQSFHHKGSSFAGQRVPGGAAARPTAPKGHSPHHGCYVQHTIFRQKKKPGAPVSLQILQLLPQSQTAAAVRHPFFHPVTPAVPGGSGHPGRL